MLGTLRALRSSVVSPLPRAGHPWGQRHLSSGLCLVWPRFRARLEDWQRQADLHFWFWVCCCTFLRGGKAQAGCRHLWDRQGPHAHPTPTPQERGNANEAAPFSGPLGAWPKGTGCCFLSLVLPGGGELSPCGSSGSWLWAFVFLGGDRSLVGGAMGGDPGCSGD